MRIKCYATGSRGNFYTITDKKNKTLMMELGIPYYEILKQIKQENISLIDVQGIIVSHKHTDHLIEKNDEKFRMLRIPIIMPPNTLEEEQNYPYNQWKRIKNFLVMPLKARHGSTNCNSYLIYVISENKYILFATDTTIIPKIKCKIEVFMVEINYIEENVKALLQEDFENENQSLAYRNRALQTHMSLEKATEYFDSLKIKPFMILTLHHSHTKGHFDREQVLKELEPYANIVDIVENGNFYEINES